MAGFSTAATLLANAAHSSMGETATYTQDGTDYACTAVAGERRESRIGLIQDWLVKSSEVAVTPAFGDTLAVGSRTFTVFRPADKQACWRYSDSAGVQKRVHTGELNMQTVMLRRPSTEFGTRGQKIDGQAEIVATPSVAIEPLNGTEREVARQQMAFATHRVLMQRTTSWNLDETCWLEWGDRRLNIGYIDDDETSGQYTLLCGEAK